MATPAERFSAESRPVQAATVAVTAPETERTGDEWVSRRVAANGVVSVAWQQVSVGKHPAGSRCDVHVDGDVLRFWIGPELVKTAARSTTGEVRKNEHHARHNGPNLNQSVKDQPTQIRQQSPEARQAHHLSFANAIAA